MKSDNYQPAKPIEVNQWIRKLTFLIMPPDIYFIAKARLPARQTAMSWNRSRMLHPTTAKNMNKRMHHDCRRHTHLSKISAFRRMQPTGTQSHTDTEGITTSQKYQRTYLNQKPTGLILKSWSPVRARPRSQELRSSCFLAYLRLLYLQSSMSLPSQERSENHEKSTDSITQLDQSYFPQVLQEVL